MVGGHGRSSRAYSQELTQPSTSHLKFYCRECGKTLKNQEKLRQHCARHGDPELECDKCHKVYASKFTLRAHRKIHMRRHPCSMCYKSFSTPKELRSHILTSHELLSCDKCEGIFDKYKDWEDHQANHEEKRDTSDTEDAISGVNDEVNTEDIIQPRESVQAEKLEEMVADREVYARDDDDDDVKLSDYVIAKVMSNDLFRRGRKYRRQKRTDKVSWFLCCPCFLCFIYVPI